MLPFGTVAKTTNRLKIDRILSNLYQNIFDPLPVLIREASGPPLIDLVVAERRRGRRR